MSEKQIIRVLLVDDHPVVLEGMQSYLNNMAHIKVVGVACNGKEAIRKTKEIMPDVLLMDISMKGINGLEATYQIKRKYPSIKILMLSIYEDPATIHRCAMMGADGYICKISVHEEIIQGIETVMSGKEYYGSNIQQILFYNTLSLAHQDTTHSFHSLSHQEQKVVQFIALKKLSLSEIAVCMNVSVNTVKSYHRRALKKLNLENITELREYFKVVDNPPNFPSL